MRVLDAPLVQACQFTGMNGEIQTGVHVATIGSKSGLAEYLVVYDPASDKIMAFRKVYLDPESPADYNISGIKNPELLEEISKFCNTEGLFDHLPEPIDDGEGESTDPS